MIKKLLMNSQKISHMIVDALKGRCRRSIKYAILCIAQTLNNLTMVKVPTVHSILYPCSMDILTILNLPIYWLSFHLFISSLISFNSVLQFLVYKFFNSLVKFIPKHFIFSEASVNEIVFLISLWIDPGCCIRIH